MTFLHLNRDRVTRFYSAEVEIVEKEGQQNKFNAVGLRFKLTYYGRQEEKEHMYGFDVVNRFLLNERFKVIKKLDKAQQIALKAASINDTLEFSLDKHFGYQRILNAKDIRNHWKVVKEELISSYPDLNEMAEDFEWQIQEDRIQEFYKNDFFFNFLFASIYDVDFSNKSIRRKKIIRNALGTLDIPIEETAKLESSRSFATSNRIDLSASLLMETPDFPLEKLNLFLGSLAVPTGQQVSLDFDYKGNYKYDTKQEWITSGEVIYTFDLKDMYSKTCKITFNLEEDE